MSRAKALTLGEQAYNAYLHQIDPQHMKPDLPQWPHHLTQEALRHWHTAVGPGIRSTKPHYRLMKAGDLPTPSCGVLVMYYKGNDGKWQPWHTERPTLFHRNEYVWVRCTYDTGNPLAIPSLG